MADVDPELTGKMITALPLDKMIAAPIMGAVQAQVQASYAYVNFLMTVCLDKDKKAIQVQFDHEESVIDGQGNLKQTQVRTIKVPLLSIISHPNFIVKLATVDFEMEVNQSMEDKSATSAGGSIEAKLGWGPLSLSVRGKVSHKSEQTRKTDTRAKYAFHVEAAHAGAPEALHRIIEAMTHIEPVNAAAPVAVP
jgi:hypothetical protein